MQWEKPSRPEEPRPETERRRRRRTGQRQRPREHTIAATNTDVPVETDTRTGVDTRGKGQLASGCPGRCDCVTTVGLTSLPQFCPRPLQRGRALASDRWGPLHPDCSVLGDPEDRDTWRAREEPRRESVGFQHEESPLHL